MDETTVKVLILKNNEVLVGKLIELPPERIEIGDPDHLLVDPVSYDEEADLDKCMVRYPSRRLTSETKFYIRSDDVFFVATPDTKLLSEYLIAISD